MGWSSSEATGWSWCGRLEDGSAWIAADRPGTYRGQCAEYCGTQHAHMAFFVVALSPAEFQDWVRQRQQPQLEPRDPHLTRGKVVFSQAGCHHCHTIRDTAARGTAGPDLPHLASRLTLGAGTLPNTTGNLEGWIADAQSGKPGIPGRPLRTPGRRRV